MDLKTYLSTKRGVAAELARRVGVKQSNLSRMKNGARKVPAQICKKIEKATCGVVTRKELRPDIF